MTTSEVRTASAIEFRGNVAEGYACLFNTKQLIGNAFYEQIAPGAFDKKNWYRDDVHCLLNHNWDRVLGRVSAGTLEVEQRPKGLWFRVEIDPRSPDGAAALSSIERGDIQGCSFGFNVLAETWHDTGEDLPTRTINSILLYEVSPCPLPAYPQTSVALTRGQQNRVAASRRIAESRRRALAAMRMRGITV